MRVISIAVVFASAVLACAPPPSSFPGGMPNSNVITREDIAALNVSNAYDGDQQASSAVFELAWTDDDLRK